MNLDIWSAVQSVPKEGLKEIKGGRLKGFTDVSPIWRYKALTELFGPCGIGWKFEIVKQWTEEGPFDQRLVFVDINLYIKHEGNWSDAIPGNGGDKVIVKESSGMYINDEAYKMATTDALGSAMKVLGVAADVYWSGGADTKYSRQPEIPVNKSQTKQDAPAPIAGMITPAHLKKIWAMAKDSGLTDVQIKEHIATNYKVDSSKKLTLNQGKDLIDWLDKKVIEHQ